MKREEATHIIDFLEEIEKVTIVLAVRCKHCGKESEVPQTGTLLEGALLLARLSCCQRSNIYHEAP